MNEMPPNKGTKESRRLLIGFVIAFIIALGIVGVLLAHLNTKSGDVVRSQRSGHGPLEPSQ